MARSLLLHPDHTTGRFLRGADGLPFLLWGESAWLLGLQRRPGISSPAAWVDDQNAYLDNRRAKGINSLLMMTHSTYQDNAPNNGDGDVVFNTPGDLATLNTTYLNKLSNLIGRCADRGFVVFLAVGWGGYDDTTQGYHAQYVSNGSTKCQTFASEIATMARDHDNIVYIVGGDKQGSFDLAPYQAFAAGIRAADTRHLVCGHWNFATGNSRSGDWNDISTAYDWSPGGSGNGPVYKQVRSEWDRIARPVGVLEALYELNTDWGYTQKGLRVQNLTSRLMGACYHFWAHEGVWHFDSSNPNLGDQSEAAPYDLESEGMQCYQSTKSLFEERRWHDLIPDPEGSTFVTAGRGTYGSMDYVGAALTNDGKFGLVYVPPGTQITVNLAKFSGQVGARYVDPTNGSVKPYVTGGLLAPSGTRNFNAASEVGNNARGASDWLICFDVYDSGTGRIRANPVIAGGPVSSSRMV